MNLIPHEIRQTSKNVADSLSLCSSMRPDSFARIVRWRRSRTVFVELLIFFSVRVGIIINQVVSWVSVPVATEPFRDTGTRSMQPNVSIYVPSI